MARAHARAHGALRFTEKEVLSYLGQRSAALSAVQFWGPKGCEHPTGDVDAKRVAGLARDLSAAALAFAETECRMAASPPASDAHCGGSGGGDDGSPLTLKDKVDLVASEAVTALDVDARAVHKHLAALRLLLRRAVRRGLADHLIRQGNEIAALSCSVGEPHETQCEAGGSTIQSSNTMLAEIEAMVAAERARKSKGAAVFNAISAQHAALSVAVVGAAAPALLEQPKTMLTAKEPLAAQPSAEAGSAAGLVRALDAVAEAAWETCTADTERLKQYAVAAEQMGGKKWVRGGMDWWVRFAATCIFCVVFSSEGNAMLCCLTSSHLAGVLARPRTSSLAAAGGSTEGQHGANRRPASPRQHRAALGLLAEVAQRVTNWDWNRRTKRSLHALLLKEGHRRGRLVASGRRRRPCHFLGW